jgi:hypothetical protein
MSLDKKIIEELKRFNQINSYVINEQVPIDVPPADPAALPPAEPAMTPAATPAPPVEGETIPEPVDVSADPDVEEITDSGEVKDETGGESEELDITDLVTTQQEIKDKQDEIMDTVFSKLDDLQSKLANMDEIMNKISNLENKFDRYREKTPEEKLMLRSLDSYPYNQKLTDFFDDKKDEMEETGKNEYVLTSDEVENFSPNEVKKTFNTYGLEDENGMNY